MYEFYNLGIGDPVSGLSIFHDLDIGDMLDEVVWHISRKEQARQRRMTVRGLQSLESRTLGNLPSSTSLVGERPCDRIRYCRNYQRCH